jgi:hypothetical protein
MIMLEQRDGHLLSTGEWIQYVTGRVLHPDNKQAGADLLTQTLVQAGWEPGEAADFGRSEASHALADPGPGWYATVIEGDKVVGAAWVMDPNWTRTAGQILDVALADCPDGHLSTQDRVIAGAVIDWIATQYR